jgi:S1-C subfamily serine protease
MASETLQQLSEQLGSAVKSAERGVVRVDTDRGVSTSGSVYDRNLVITSNAELGRGEPTRVTSHAGETLSAELVGRDAGFDVALLRVAGELEALAFTDTAGVAVGQLALALGRPGRSIRASLRIIGLTAEDVETPHGTRLGRYIESDRGFPSGFGGGPLIDVQGRALGMNSMRLIRNADLTLPRETLDRSVAQLLAHGTIARGYLGVAAQPVRLPQALRQRLGRRSGAMVLAVAEGSPAERAGVLFGDTIVALDGQPVSGPRELVARLRERAGLAIEVELVRAGALSKVTVTPAAQGPAQAPAEET